MSYLRYFFFTILSFCCTIAANATAISFNEAQNIARDFFSTKNTTQALKAKPKSTTPTNENAPLYIFVDSDNNFVIISGDNRARKILGYGINWNSDNTPAAVDSLLISYASQINSIKDSAPSNPIAATETSTSEKILNTASWGQETPFNNLSPSGYPAGCVATAMATVMKYHEWPDCGRGFNSYEWGGQMLSCDFANTPFDWSNMLDYYSETTGYTETQADAVAQLLKACGISVDMYYAPDGSAATIMDAAIALNKYFKYDGSCQYLSSSDFSHDEWEDLIRTEIDAGRPVIYSGKSSSGAGHAFVCDGYNSDGLFHFNWGWSGGCNGFYALSALKPMFTDYSLNGAMLINIIPAADDDISYAPLMTSTTGMGLSIDTENIETGVPFNAFVGGISTLGDYSQWEGQLALALVDSVGTIKELIRTIDLQISSFVQLSTEFINCIATKEISTNDRLQLLARSVTWQPIRETIVRPASCPAKGNTVRRGKITWDIHPDTLVISLNQNCGNTSLTEPLLSSPFEWTATIPENTASLYYAINGTEISSPDGSYSIASINGDYTITIKAYTADELIDNYSAHVPAAGSLASIIDSIDARLISSLTLTGNIDSRDFDFIKNNMTSLSSVDMSQANISSRLSNYARHIPANAFDGCKRLKSVILPNNLVGIHQYAFRRTSIQSIDLPKSVTKIEDGAFYMAENLSLVTARNPVPVNINSRVFFGTKRSTGTLFIPVGSYDQYKTQTFWGMFAKIIEDESITGIKDIHVTPHPVISIANGHLTISEIDDTILCEIYDTRGALIFRTILADDATVELSLKTGIYILKIGNTAKVIKITR